MFTWDSSNRVTLIPKLSSEVCQTCRWIENNVQTAPPNLRTRVWKMWDFQAGHISELGWCWWISGSFRRHFMCFRRAAAQKQIAVEQICCILCSKQYRWGSILPGSGHPAKWYQRRRKREIRKDFTRCLHETRLISQLWYLNFHLKCVRHVGE